MVVKLRVYRYNPDVDDAPHYEIYEVPYVDRMNVLQALNYIHDNLDSSLSYRWNCRAGQCGSCAILINGKPRVTCREVLQDNTTVTLTPLLHVPVIKDLVSDVTPLVERLMKCRPYVERLLPPKRPEIIKQNKVEPIKDLRTCIECWACVSACPTVAEAWQDFSGPLVQRQIARLKLDERDSIDRVKMAFIEGAYNCTTCKACVEACPKTIDIPTKAIEKLRAYIVAEGLGPLEGHLSFIRNIEKTGRSIDRLKTPLLETVPELIKVDNPVDEVAFFTGCLIDYRLQNTGLNLIEILKRNRVNVHIPKSQSCCASPAFRTGVVNLAESQVKKNVEVFEKIGVEKVVVGCAGCGMTMKKDFVEVMNRVRGKPPAFKVYDITEYLINILGTEKLNRKDLKPINMKITYHDPCHLNRSQNVKEEPRTLLNLVPQLKLVEMSESDRCCGSGGGVRSGVRPIAMAVGRRKGISIMNTGVDACVTECPFCHIQIGDVLQQLGSNIKTYEIADILAASYVGKL